jgi:hypothetical protein
MFIFLAIGGEPLSESAAESAPPRRTLAVPGVYDYRTAPAQDIFSSIFMSCWIVRKTDGRKTAMGAICTLRAAWSGEAPARRPANQWTVGGPSRYFLIFS